MKNVGQHPYQHHSVGNKLTLKAGSKTLKKKKKIKPGRNVGDFFFFLKMSF